MSQPGRFVLAIAIALGSLRAPAQVAPLKATPPPRGNESILPNKDTNPQTPVPPADDRALSLRIYGAFNEKRPLPGAPGTDNADYAVDVSEVVTRCADGSTVITALVIGGQRTVLNNRCPAEVGRSPGGQTTACDANRWTCRTGRAPPAN